MSEIIIKLENISKQYRLGQVGTQTLRGDFQRWWHRIRGKEDPTLKIGSTNALDMVEGEYVWALRDINLEVKQGEVLGIIGKNGAGKSTLLKLLSRVTAPTTGQIKIKGRIASLLEVGTGFHPELTGRENIFLNGAILGMTKPEIKSKFDEIVDFAGVAKYIDTPVKRYSSGMYVRLAFAVAAHLEPDILVVDEVLAVGDAEFQKKAIGKMQDISTGQRRTVLFVSHNMAAVKKLCKTGILLKNGQLLLNDSAEKTVECYQYEYTSAISNQIIFEDNNNFKDIQLKKVTISPSNGNIIDIESGISINIWFASKKEKTNITASINVYTTDDIHLFEAPCFLSMNNDSVDCIYDITALFPPYFLNSGIYKIKFVVGENQKYVLYNSEDLLTFAVEETSFNKGNNLNRLPGLLRPNIKWRVNQVRN